MPDVVDCLSFVRTHSDIEFFVCIYVARSDMGSRMPPCIGRSIHGRLFTCVAIHSDMRLALAGMSRWALAHASAYPFGVMPRWPGVYISLTVSNSFIR